MVQLSRSMEPLKTTSKPSSDKKKQIARHIEQILEILGLDLEGTPDRVAKMYVDDFFSGLASSPPEVTLHTASTFAGKVVVREIPITSFCKHHLVPMIGTVNVAYVPRKGVIGLSKLEEVIRHLARRPQLQESLTHEIAQTLEQVLCTPDVAVMMRAQHFCVMARGVEDPHSFVETYVFKGSFEGGESLFASLHPLTSSPLSRDS